MNAVICSQSDKSVAHFSMEVKSSSELRSGKKKIGKN